MSDEIIVGQVYMHKSGLAYRVKQVGVDDVVLTAGSWDRAVMRSVLLNPNEYRLVMSPAKIQGVEK